MGMKEAIRTCYLEKYVTFTGRAPRSEYWYFYLFFMLVFLVVGVLAYFLGGGEDWVYEGPNMLGYVFAGIFGLFYLGSILPMISVTVRRLHDRNLSGWWLLAAIVVGMVPFVGFIASIALFVITVLKGTEGDNKFGSDPLQDPTDASVFG